MAAPTFSGVLIGDELGFIKRLNFRSCLSSKELTTLNREFIGEASPDRSVLSIYPLIEASESDADEDSKDGNSDNEPDDIGRKNDSSRHIDRHGESKYIYLISSKPNHIYLYNSFNERFYTISSSNHVDSNSSGNLVGVVPINGNSFVSCYDNGRINVQNISSDILAISSSYNKKALKFLGVDREENSSTSTEASSSVQRPSGTKRLKKFHHKSGLLDANQKITGSSHSCPDSSTPTIFLPNWQPPNTCLTCFKVGDNRIAVGGRNVDLRVFDLNTKKCTFTAKSQSKDFLGLRNKLWISDVDWLGPLSGKSAMINKSTLLSSPSMVATCSRTDPVVRIFDLRSRTRKPIWMLNFKEQTFNNDSNPPAFTRICSTPTPTHTNLPTQQLILGTTMGRMMAVDLRFNPHSYRHLGVFKGFGGGSIRDIKVLPLGNNSSKVISCSLDRFVRVHSFSSGADKSRTLDCCHYVKTKPTCVYPILSDEICAEDYSDQIESNSNSEEVDFGGSL